MDKPKFHSTTAVAYETGVDRVTVYRQCLSHPGFAIRFGKQFKIPDAHLARVRAGERVEDIAAEARKIGAFRAA